MVSSGSGLRLSNVTLFGSQHNVPADGKLGYREMTLKEWVDQLPPFHRAIKELEFLHSELQRYQNECSRQQRSIDRLTEKIKKISK